MKITKIDVMQVDCGSASNAAFRPVVCRIYTDSGIYGDGEAAIAYAKGSTAAFGMVQDLSSLVMGMDPLDNELIWEKMYKTSFWGQNGGPIVFAGMSAIDIALWDIKGKYYNTPVYKLLGGKVNSSLRCYASQLQFGWCEDKMSALTTEDYVQYAKMAVDDGYDAIKIDFLTFDTSGRRFRFDETNSKVSDKTLLLAVERIKAVREAVGEDVDLLVEVHAVLDLQGAIKFAKMIEPYHILYMEEPTTPDPNLTKKLHEKISIPIAHGERIYSRWQYMPYFQDGSLALIQPDIGNCGGITEAKKICDLAHIFDVGVQMHVCASPLSTAAALQLETAISNFTIHEHHVYNLHPYLKQLCIYDHQPVHGEYTVPELPGLGNELSEYCFLHSKRVTIE